MAFKTSLEINGIFLGYFIVNTALLLTYLIIFITCINFTKSAKEAKENIDKYDKFALLLS